MNPIELKSLFLTFYPQQFCRVAHLSLLFVSFSSALPNSGFNEIPLKEVSRSPLSPHSGFIHTIEAGLEKERRHGCQMANARFLDSMCLALQASGLWLRFATLQNLLSGNLERRTMHWADERPRARSLTRWFEILHKVIAKS